METGCPGGHTQVEEIESNNYMYFDSLLYGYSPGCGSGFTAHSLGSSFPSVEVTVSLSLPQHASLLNKTTVNGNLLVMISSAARDKALQASTNVTLTGGDFKVSIYNTRHVSTVGNHEEKLT